MKWEITHEVLRSDFVREVELRSGQSVTACYQCGKCSAGCPICFDMDYSPNQIMRMVQLGMRDEVLSSRSIWLCASCETCTTRCPREVDLANVMDALRRMSHRGGAKTAEKDLPLFDEIFLENIRRYGRLFELGLIGNFNLNSGHFFKDILMAPAMFLKGKINLFPHRTRNVKAVRKIFSKANKSTLLKPKGQE